jgi:hypothetical protein
MACRTASIAATGALLAIGAAAACHDMAQPEIPPVTTARPDGQPLLGPSTASLSTDAGGVSSAMGAPLESPVKAKFVDTPAKLEAALCQRVLVAVVKGKISALGETLSAGDVLVLTNGESFEAKGTGTVVWAEDDLSDCVVLSHPGVTKVVIRGATAPELKWAGGAMSAHLDVATVPPSMGSAGATGGKPALGASPELYLGRLEGTAPVPEHVHSGSWEILAAVEASGTFVLDGTEGRLAARQIVIIPPGSKHAWKPEPGSKLVAIQMYSPPGPEQRFLGLAAAEKDAGARDAR